MGDLKDMPVYAGHLKRFDKEKNSGSQLQIWLNVVSSGVISSPGALADFKQNVYVHGSVLHNSKVSLKDLVCFAVHTPLGFRLTSLPLRKECAWEASGLQATAAPSGA